MLAIQMLIFIFYYWFTNIFAFCAVFIFAWFIWFLFFSLNQPMLWRIVFVIFLHVFTITGGRAVLAILEETGPSICSLFVCYVIPG